MEIDFTKEELLEFTEAVCGFAQLRIVEGLISEEVSAEDAYKGRAMLIRIGELVEEYGP